MPAWTVSDLIESLPLYVPLYLWNEETADRHHLEISNKESVWKISYGNVFQTEHTLLKEALLNALRHIFTKYKVRTQKCFLNSFFKDVFNGIYCNSDECLFYFDDIADMMKKWEKKYKIMEYYTLIAASSYKGVWLMFIRPYLAKVEKDYEEKMLSLSDYKRVKYMSSIAFYDLYKMKIKQNQ